MRSGKVFSEWWKIKREIETHGNCYDIYRNVLDEYGEATGKSVKITTIQGLFHISGSYVSRETKEGTETRTKRSPMLLCLWEDTEEVQNKDIVVINNQKFIIINKRNINEYNIVCDMSLEEVLNGSN